MGTAPAESLGLEEVYFSDGNYPGRGHCYQQGQNNFHP